MAFLQQQSVMFHSIFSKCAKFMTFACMLYLLDSLPVAEAECEKINVTEKVCSREADKCRKGVILPKWEPDGDLGAGDKAARAIVYFTTLVYLFLGVSIISDRFMSSIEVITSKEKEIVVKKPGGQTTVVSVRIWNETVSNLTLMALGSSAPEILLSVIEICGNEFIAGDLGPSTIVGSAAFNLFVITAICIWSLPNKEIRRIKHLRVFFITASWSVFAYLWLYFILSISSCGVVDLWEGILTFLFFPATVLTAYVVDKKLFPYKFLSKKYRSSRHAGMVVTADADSELADGKINHLDDVTYKGVEGDDEEVKEFEKHRKEFMEILRDLRRKNPNIDMRTLEEMAEFEAINRGPKSRAYYRIQATRKLTGSGNVIKKQKIEKKSSLQDIKMELKEDDTITRVFFDPGHYTVMENIGTFYLTVTREGGDLGKTLYVDYKTEDGSANAESDYEPTQGTLVFHPLETHKQFSVTILDDDIFEEDEHFYVKLENLRIGDAEGLFESDQYSGAVAVLSAPFTATVMILDDDHPGIFHFEQPEMTVTESIGEVEIQIVRSSGARGSVKVPFHFIDGSAKSGKDYNLLDDDVIFQNDETSKTVHVKIVDDEEYEKSEVFYIQLDEPFVVKGKGSGKEPDKDSGTEPNMLNEEEMRLAELGKPRLGDNEKLAVHIKESYEFKNVVDKLLKKANVSLVVGTSSWREQFIEAISVSAEGSGQKDGGEEDDEEAEEKLPSCMDYVMHFLTLFWKILFAFVPPTDYWGGWACFIFSIILIGVLTAFIGDVASHFGCTVGMKDAVTAISLVALGTSVPDTFASKTAAINDRYADSSIGNVTGSNAVNVFLGIGIAWTVAAIYRNLKGEDFTVDPGTLAFSVTVFCCLAVVAMATLMLRRYFAGGELGGKSPSKHVTAVFFFSLWVTYVILSAMVDYCYIPGF